MRLFIFLLFLLLSSFSYAGGRLISHEVWEHVSMPSDVLQSVGLPTKHIPYTYADMPNQTVPINQETFIYGNIGCQIIGDTTNPVFQIDKYICVKDFHNDCTHVKDSIELKDGETYEIKSDTEISTKIDTAGTSQGDFMPANVTIKVLTSSEQTAATSNGTVCVGKCN